MIHYLLLISVHCRSQSWKNVILFWQNTHHSENLSLWQLRGAGPLLLCWYSRTKMSIKMSLCLLFIKFNLYIRTDWVYLKPKIPGYITIFLCATLYYSQDILAHVFSILKPGLVCCRPLGFFLLPPFPLWMQNCDAIKTKMETEEISLKVKVNLILNFDRYF